MKKNIETVLKTFLSNEQIAVLKEELTSGIKKINSAVDSNERMKAKKELMIETFRKIDELIEKSDRSPLLFKTFYAAAKTNISRLIQPILEEMIEDEQIKGLDDIPDVSKPEKKKEAPVEKPVKKETPPRKKDEEQKPSQERKKTFHKNNSHRPKPKDSDQPQQDRRNLNRKDAGKNQKGR